MGKPQAIFAAIAVAARCTGIALPRDPVRYDPEQYPHWDFLVRFGRRQALCAAPMSLGERIAEATTTARIYMDGVICAGGR